ncbi:hypothetical protein [Nocardia sp. NPDC058705]|uniref:hypothetical protein n=1 Tax=Nocardia sp. NPDC058705 TaxID=3346609 RepID=UPI0036A56802
MARKNRWGTPRSIYLYRTLGGWRHSMFLLNGGMICGALGKGSVSTSVEVAQAELQGIVEFLLDGEGSAHLQWGPSANGAGWIADVDIRGSLVDDIARREGPDLEVGDH